MAAKKNNVKYGLRLEIIAIILFFSAILVTVSVLGFAGTVGGWLSSLFLGLIGIGAFILPVGLVAFGILLLKNRHKKLSKLNLFMYACLFLVLISLVHLAGFSREYDASMGAYIASAFRYGAWSNGGVFGALLSSFFVWVWGEVITYIFFIAVIGILFILLSGRSLFSTIQEGYGTIRKGVDNTMQKRREKLQKAKEEQEAMQALEEAEAVAAPMHAEDSRSMPKNFVVEPLDDNTTPPSRYPALDAGSPQHNLQPFNNQPSEIADQVRNDEEITHDDETIIHNGETVARNDEGQTQDEAKEEETHTINIQGLVEGVKPQETQKDSLPWDDEVIVELEPLAEPRISIEPRIEPKAAIAMEEYIFPPVELLRENTYTPSLSSQSEILQNSKKLEDTLQSFGVKATVVEVSCGPAVTRYELSPGVGVKVSKIAGLADDLALNLAAETIRIEAPVPGKSVVGIEMPNKEVQAVFFREVLDNEAFWSSKSKLSFAMGKDIAGNIAVGDIAKMPHLLVAGSTGSGKSVFINTLITSIIYKASPKEVKLLMIDPKVVELSIYNGIPHLLIPVVTDPQKASGALGWAVREMENRYALFAEANARNLEGYNKELIEAGKEAIPQIVIIIDELADLMMTCGKEVESSIVRIAQKARAAGIHLILATQRPSVDVITGLIKANVPSRLAFAVSSGTDSRTILDMTGAEKLLGKGDMLFNPVGTPKPRRIQGSFISDKEVEAIVNFIKQDGATEYSEEMIEKITSIPDEIDFSDESDPFIDEAIAFIVEKEKASTSMLQRKFRIGYNRAARMMEELEGRGLIGPEDGAKPRKVLMTPYQHREYVQRRQEAIDSSINNGDF
ncbi:MAG: DNA translocase FtsK [Defluviitaleaceae bacterium]|nr:DNA translocase FtsK [Defluviitaleaceae bacterium]